MRSRKLLTEATARFVNGVNNWIYDVTDGGDYPLKEVLPWGDLFDDKLRVAIPAVSDDDVNLEKIVMALRSGGWGLPIRGQDHTGVNRTDRGFPTRMVAQKKRRAGSGEEYEEEAPVAKLDIERIDIRVIPKGPRAGEEVKKEETTTMSRAINKATKLDKELNSYIAPELAEWWQKKQTYYTKAENAKIIEKIFIKDPDEEATTSDQMIIISRHPIDVLRMGDVETVGVIGSMGKIGHCHREKGEYSRCAQQEALGHGPIAYLVSKRDLDKFLEKNNKDDISEFDEDEIFKDRDRDIDGLRAINRLRLRQYREDETNEMWAVPELKVYPGADVVPGFRGAVNNWAWEQQREMYEDAYDKGDFPSFDRFERLGGKYADTKDGILLNNFFAKSGVSPDYPVDWVPYEDEEAEHLDPSPGDRAEIMDDRVQEIMETMNGRMEHSSVHGEVDIYDEEPVCLMSGHMQILFNEDLFGEDGGAKYELPDTWSSSAELYNLIREALADEYVYLNDDMDIDEYNNKVNVNFRIDNPGDYENNAEGFDSFADYVESEFDNNYDTIRAVVKRVLITEGYMGPDAYELLRQKLAGREEDEDTRYRHWDFDIDGNEITFMLKDPKEAATTQRFHGLYLGKIPTGTSLTYVLYDWQYEKSKEFDEIYIPKIRTLFEEAEKAALKQLSLPGIEAQEMHGLLLPSRAQFRLKQVFTDYSAPAYIYLQIKMDINEEITEEQTEEIEYFLKYLDQDSKIKIIEEAAVETFEELLGPALERRKIQDKVVKLTKNISPIMDNLSLYDLLEFSNNLLAIDQEPRHLIDVITRRLNGLMPKDSTPGNPGGWLEKFNQDTVTKKITLEKLKQALGKFDDLELRAPLFQDPKGSAATFLGIKLRDSAAGDQALGNLSMIYSTVVRLKDSILRIILDTINRAVTDPLNPQVMGDIAKVFPSPPWPSWYADQMKKAGVSGEQVMNMLPPKAQKNPRSAETQAAVDKLSSLFEDACPKRKKIRIRIKNKETLR
tara:strand:- start:107 stop:3127 length:3021 start_codon:yes stop_codon:yes gene_type:complete